MTRITSKVCTTRSCNKAGQLQPIANFHIRRESPDGHASSCATCVNQREARRRAKNRTIKPPKYVAPPVAWPAPTLTRIDS